MREEPFSFYSRITVSFCSPLSKVNAHALGVTIKKATSIKSVLISCREIEGALGEGSCVCAQQLPPRTLLYIFFQRRERSFYGVQGRRHHFIFHPPAGLLIKKILCIIARAPSLYTQGVIISGVRAGGSRAAAAAALFFILIKICVVRREAF